MPNWNNNTIICKPDLCSYILDGENNVDFNILIPEPRTKEECIHEYGKEYLLDGKQGIELIEGREWFNWYDWHCDFWGVKWNACETNAHKDNDYYYITFDTPWSPPTKWLSKLSALGKPFILWEEEETCEGSVIGFNGKIDIEKAWSRDWNIEDSEDDPNYNNDFPELKTIKKFFGDE